MFAPTRHAYASYAFVERQARWNNSLAHWFLFSFPTRTFWHELSVPTVSFLSRTVQVKEMETPYDTLTTASKLVEDFGRKSRWGVSAIVAHLLPDLLLRSKAGRYCAVRLWEWREGAGSTIRTWATAVLHKRCGRPSIFSDGSGIKRRLGLYPRRSMKLQNYKVANVELLTLSRGLAGLGPLPLGQILNSNSN